VDESLAPKKRRRAWEGKPPKPASLGREVGRAVGLFLFPAVGGLLFMCSCGHFGEFALLVLLAASSAAWLWAGTRPFFGLHLAAAVPLTFMAAKAVQDVGWRGHGPLFSAPPPFMALPLDIGVPVTLLGVGAALALALRWRAREVRLAAG
jgi:hypothetical protein